MSDGFSKAYSHADSNDQPSRTRYTLIYNQRAKVDRTARIALNVNTNLNTVYLIKI
jgi:hypothetical protein